ncbi:MAG: ATP-binding cassette domain-containing protein [Candidatus Aminicenantales bacterium]
MEVIAAKNLVVGYGDSVILEDLNFFIAKGKITVIVGESGSGKTTLFRTLIGLLPPLSGEMYLSGVKVDFHSEKSLQSLYREIGVLYQGGALINSLSLYENVALPIRIHFPGLPKEIEASIVLSKLSQVGLRECSEKYPSELSGGMRKRAALARAMVLDPQIIICDEPSSGLDPITSSSLDDLLLDLKSRWGMTLVVITHELRSIEKIADRVIILNNGRILFNGEQSLLDSTEDPYIQTFFLKRGNHGDQRAKN